MELFILPSHDKSDFIRAGRRARRGRTLHPGNCRLFHTTNPATTKMTMLRKVRKNPIGPPSKRDPPLGTVTCILHPAFRHV